MDISVITDLVTSLGFPIALVIAMGAFVYRFYNDSTARNKEREEKLYQCINDNQNINSKALETLSLYAERLGIIEDDIKDIKKDITIIAEKME